MSHFRIKRLAGVRLPQHFLEEFGDTSVNNHCGGGTRDCRKGRKMDEQGASAHRNSEIPMATAAELLTLSSICPACGYPTIGMGLCAYCRPLMEGPAAATA